MTSLLDIYTTGPSANRMAELHDVVQPTLVELAQSLGYERAFLTVLNADKNALEGVFGVNIPMDLLETFNASLEEPTHLVQSLLDGRVRRVDDVLRDSYVSERLRPFYVNSGMLAFAAIPLVPISGVLVVSKGRPLSEGEINEVLPYVGQLVANLARRIQDRRLEEADERHAVNEEWLWWMVNSAQNPIILADEDNNIIFQNTHAERLLKTSPEDSAGKHRAIELNNFLLSASLSSFALDQGVALGRELTLVDPIEGTEILFEVICRPCTNLRTGDRGLVCFLNDVTVLEHASEQLRQSLEELSIKGEEVRQERDRLNLILESVADPIVVTDPSSEIILMNPTAERLLQTPDRGTTIRRATAYLTNDAKLTSFLSQLGMEASHVLRGGLDLIDPISEEPLTMSVTATEVRNELGQVIAVVAVLHDLTVVRELERRTLEQQLFESEKLAAVGRLAAAVAHEINNPLEAIKNSLYLVASATPADAPHRKFIDIATKETQRVSGIIHQMLGFYRPGTTKAAVDLNMIIEDTLTLLENQFRRHHVVVRTDLDRNLPIIEGAADQLKQVFLNLFLNAEGAMKDGGELHVNTRLSTGEDIEFVLGKYALVQVRDTGSGITVEHLQHIFDPFFSTKQEQRGTGLGLWVSQGIVQQHRGQIKVRSRPGTGSTFTVALPIGGQDE